MTTVAVNTHFGLSGRFRLIRTAADGTVRQDTGWFKNLILNIGLDWFGGAPAPGGFPIYGGCHVGSGNTPPAGGDTQLQTWVAGTIDLNAQSHTVVSTSPYKVIETSTYRFALGAAAGNLAEVGISQGDIVAGVNSAALSSRTLFSRALIVDSFGVPTTITVLSDEYLDVMWEYTIWPPPADVAGSFNMTILGVVTAFSYVIRPSLLANQLAWRAVLSTTSSRTNRPIMPITLGGSSMASGQTSGLAVGPIQAVTSFPSGTNAVMNVNGTTSAYTTGTYFRDLQWNYGLNDGNVTGIGAMLLHTNVGQFQMSISPTMTKINTQVFTVECRVSWANH